MAQNIEEITFKLLREAQRWGSKVILDVADAKERTAKAVGFADPGEMEGGLWYRLMGRWVNHHQYGRQFAFNSFVPSRPIDQESMVRYLVRAPGIGKVTAAKLWKLYGQDAVEKLRESPASVQSELDAKGFTQEKAEQAAAFLRSISASEKATIELAGLFAGRGFPRSLVNTCLREWGNGAFDIIKADPFVLLQFGGVGFAKADALYCELGLDRAALKRQALCAWYRLDSDSSGSTWLPASEILKELNTKIGSGEARPGDAIQFALDQHLVSARKDTAGSIWFASRERAISESSLSKKVAEMIHYGQPSWPKVDELEDVSDHQREELAKSLKMRIGIFGGGPGTGKTYTAARLIAQLLKVGKVAVAAPTGKAAVRITESLRGYGVNVTAKTIHGLLGVQRSGDGDDFDGQFGFAHGEDMPLEHDFIIVDESSMIDTPLMASLLRAVSFNAHVLLVGDLNQLPPVGHGAPLRDLLSFRVPSGCLTEIQRNSGTIVKTCDAIRSRQGFVLPNTLDIPNGINLICLRSDTASIAGEVARLIKIFKDKGVNATWDVQVLVALNEAGDCSRKAVNALLQPLLNGENRPTKDMPLWVGDKVVCMKNAGFPPVDPSMDWSTDDEDEEDFGEVVMTEDASGKPLVYVANGEIGKVLSVDPKKAVVEFYSPKRVVLVPAGGEKLQLAYALSVHKSQGSEWPWVIGVVDRSGGARLVCDRGWLYTAISRAKKGCILVGDPDAARDMCIVAKIEERKTFLVELAKKELEILLDKSKEVKADGESDQAV